MPLFAFIIAGTLCLCLCNFGLMTMHLRHGLCFASFMRRKPLIASSRWNLLVEGPRLPFYLGIYCQGEEDLGGESLVVQQDIFF